MAGILNIVVDPITPERIIRAKLPRSKRTNFASTNPFAMPTLGAALGREKVVIATALVDVRALRNAR
jgi:hypothetical protein